MGGAIIVVDLCADFSGGSLLFLVGMDAFKMGDPRTTYGGFQEGVCGIGIRDVKQHM